MRLSIIVCTRNRDYAIADCLNAIAASLQNAAPLDAEIIVVDNGSTDTTSATINAWAKTCPFPVNLQYEKRKGLSHARNCGIDAARGKLLVFTDDDCRMHPQYVRDCLRYDNSDSALVIRGGSTLLGDPTDLPITIKIDPNSYSINVASAPANYTGLADIVYGCNMTMRKELAQIIGYFDTRLGAGTNLPAGEDTDYIYRAFYAGYTIAYVNDMSVYHFHGRKTKQDGLNIMKNYSIGSGALYAKYLRSNPRIARQLYWDARNMVKGFFTGKYYYVENLQYTLWQRLIDCLTGVSRYYGKTLEMKLSPKR